MGAPGEPQATELEPAPAEALARLAGSTSPLLVGVRHHSPACAAAMPALLDAFGPTRVLIELPAELGRLLPWLGHAELVTPVALAAVREPGGGSLFFYPFADFSPELAAVRWARARGVAVEGSMSSSPSSSTSRRHTPSAGSVVPRLAL